MTDMPPLLAETWRLNPDGSPPELDPELKDCIRDSRIFGSRLVHPFVMDVPYMEIKNGLYNEQIAYKREATAKALANESWDEYLWLHERPFRVDALRDMEPLVTDDVQWWSLVTVCWVDSENIYENVDDWLEIFDSGRPEREAMMTEEDAEVFSRLPDKITVYRGSHAPDRLGSGLSWTLNRDRARWFARRLCSEGEAAWVTTGRIEKANIIAYISGRNEEEVIVMPENVRVMRQVREKLT